MRTLAIVYVNKHIFPYALSELLASEKFTNAIKLNAKLSSDNIEDKHTQDLTRYFSSFFLLIFIVYISVHCYLNYKFGVIMCRDREKNI